MMSDRALQELKADYLTRSGWLRSVDLQCAIDATGPVPWFTYPAIRFLERIARPDWRVLEYGSGNSTRWWATRVAEVVAVEHDPAFAGALSDERIPNVRLVERCVDDPLSPAVRSTLLTEYLTLGRQGRPTADPTRNYRAGLLDASFQAYAAVGLDYPTRYFDVVVVDGMARVLTAWVAARQLGREGIVVFDNADRVEYADGYALLAEAGFARIDFWGMGPINPYEWCTSVFIRSLTSLAGGDGC